MFVVYLSRKISHISKKPIKAGTIEQKITLTKGALEHRRGIQLLRQMPRVKKLLEYFKRRVGEEERRQRFGIRGAHLRTAWATYDASYAVTSDITGMTEWVLVTLAWHLLMRGGELQHITLNDVVWESNHAVIWLQPLKKRGGDRRKKVPQLIRFVPEQGEWQPYLALRRLTIELYKQNREEDDLLLARDAAGVGRVPYETGHVRCLARHIASLASLQPRKYGAQSFRIGGATDLANSDEPHTEAGLRAAGRWGSDIARIYARLSRVAHLQRSSAMFASDAQPLEEAERDFAQPSFL